MSFVVYLKQKEKTDFGGGGIHIEERVESRPSDNSVVIPQSHNTTSTSTGGGGINKSLNVDDLIIIKSSFESES